ncbi:hypothetical protein [Methylomonas albis]|uniref:DUF1566 domain-containing protein n=1 Tax=Methylomonas albis TaxID=1854563 RepID=A0ABR9D0B2_9GAMM|nr:DUF1566 domain-containing protein [Methylomonas albis]MBD9356569.1 DUF1566 domain-containing protein [Methylomonas albis]CAD6879690.1 hypothetical protein [Methylomonas albis]
MQSTFTKLKPNRALAGLTLSLTLAFFNQATAALTDNGNGLIYDSGLDITWTQDANLLVTKGGINSTVVNEILAANPHGVVDPYYLVNSPNTGVYTLSAADFHADGTATWWGAQAFVHYLNFTTYGGTDKWQLPASTAISGFNSGSELGLGELFYNELGGIGGTPLATSGPFNNIQSGTYWTGTENHPPSSAAWYFRMSDGGQTFSSKTSSFFVWAVAPGNVSVSQVPVPSAIWLFGSGMLGLLRLKHRHQIN